MRSGLCIMKLVQSLVVATALAIPGVSSFAQSNPAVTATNIQLADYSANVANRADADYGGVADGTSASGTHHKLHAIRNALSRVAPKIEGSIRPDANDGMKPVYFGS